MFSEKVCSHRVDFVLSRTGHASVVQGSERSWLSGRMRTNPKGSRATARLAEATSSQTASGYPYWHLTPVELRSRNLPQGFNASAREIKQPLITDEHPIAFRKGRCLHNFSEQVVSESGKVEIVFGPKKLFGPI